MTNTGKRIEMGDKILIHYRIILDDGSEFESTFNGNPLEITVGETNIIKGLHKTLLEMRENETRTVTFGPDDAYGHHNPELIAVLNKDELPPNSIPAVGWLLKIGTFKVIVKEINEKTVTLDGNHPLVDQSVSFEIKILKVSR